MNNNSLVDKSIIMYKIVYYRRYLWSKTKVSTLILPNTCLLTVYIWTVLFPSSKMYLSDVKS